MPLTRERVLAMLNRHYYSMCPETAGFGLDPYYREAHLDYPMAWAVYSVALAKLGKLRGDDQALHFAKACLRKLGDLSVTSAINCWGPPFEWKGFPAGTPMASTTAIAGEAFAQFCRVAGSDSDGERAIAICDWLVTELPWTMAGNSGCPWYGVKWPVLVTNVACMVGALLLEVGAQFQIDAFLEHGLAAFRHTCAQQHPFGLWRYAERSSLLPNAHEVVDAVHTAFVLLGLERMETVLGQLGYDAERRTAREQIAGGTRFLSDYLMDERCVHEKVLVLSAERLQETYARSRASRDWQVFRLEDGLFLVRQPGLARLWSLGSVLSALALCGDPRCGQELDAPLGSLERLQRSDGRFRYGLGDDTGYVRHESFAFLGLVDALGALSRPVAPQSVYGEAAVAKPGSGSRNALLREPSHEQACDWVHDNCDVAGKLRVAIVVDSLGEERCVREASILAAAGLRVTLIGAATTQGLPSDEAIDMIGLPRSSRPSRWWQSALSLRRVRPRYAHAHSSTGLVLFTRAAALLQGITFVSDFNDILVRECPVSGRAYFDQAELWGSQVSQEEQARIEQVLEVLPIDVKSVLDVGCGDGRLTNQLTKFPLRVVGVDSSAEALQYVRTETRLASADRLPFPDGEFDVVMATELLEHLPRGVYRRALKEMTRVACAYIVVSVPNRENLALGQTRCARCGKQFHVNGHYRSYTPTRLRRLFGRSARCERLRFIGADRLRYSAPLLYIRRYIGGYWPRSRTTVCPRCGAQGLLSNYVEVGSIRRWCDQKNKQVSAKKPVMRRHMVALFRKRDGNAPQEH